MNLRNAGFVGSLSGLGISAQTAANSALAIKQATGTNVDGFYWINVPGSGVKEIYCVMDSSIDGGGWMLMDSQFRTWNNSTYSYDVVNRRFNLYAATSQLTGEHYGAGYILTIPFTISKMYINHTGGSGYSCAGVLWNNRISIGKSLSATTSGYYPGWDLASGTTVVSAAILVDGWNSYSFASSTYQLHCGLGAYQHCQRITHTQQVLVK